MLGICSLMVCQAMDWFLAWVELKPEISYDCQMNQHCHQFTVNNSDTHEDRSTNFLVQIKKNSWMQNKLSCGHAQPTHIRQPRTCHKGIKTTNDHLNYKFKTLQYASIQLSTAQDETEACTPEPILVFTKKKM